MTQRKLHGFDLREIERVSLPEEIQPKGRKRMLTAEEEIKRSAQRAEVWMRLNQDAAETYRDTPLESFKGFRDLLSALLPADEAEGERVAAAIGVAPMVLRDLLRGELIATEIDPWSVAFLAEMLGVGADRLVELAQADAVEAGKEDLQDLEDLREERENLDRIWDGL